jgi:hypothetical protein
VASGEPAAGYKEVQGSFGRADGALLQDDSCGVAKRAGAPALHFAQTFGIRVKIKGNVKGNGQECPFHMGVALLR